MAVSAFGVLANVPAQSNAPVVWATNAQEQFVFSTICAGSPAHLENFPETELSYKFLDYLIDSGATNATILRHGIVITGAVFKEPMIFRSCNLNFEFELRSCIFDDQFALLDS